jgi:hypothetical protein
MTVDLSPHHYLNEEVRHCPRIRRPILSPVKTVCMVFEIHPYILSNYQQY